MGDRKKVIEARGSAFARRFATAVAALCLVLAPSAAAAVTDASDAGDWVTDGPVYAIAHASGRTFIGGDFTHVGLRTGPGVPLDASGAPLPPYPEVAGGDVYAAVPDNAGGWYIGGNFSSVGGIGRGGLARILSDGIVDPAFNPAPNGTVRAIVVASQSPDADSGGTIYIGGDFTQVAGKTRNHAAALTPLGGVKSWNPAPNDSVYALAEGYFPLNVKPSGATTDTVVSTPVVVMGGDFATAGSSSGTPPANVRVAAIWGVGSVDGTGADNAGVSLGSSGSWAAGGPSARVRTLALGPVTAKADGSKQAAALYVGGDFTSPHTGLVAAPLSISTASGASGHVADSYNAITWSSSWNAAADCVSPAGCTPTVNALALSGSTLYVGGGFTKLAGAPASYAAAVAAISDPTVSPANAATLAAWAPAANGPVRALAVNSAGVVLGGSFTALGTDSRAHLAATDATTGATLDWNPSAAGGTVNTLAASGATVYAGGGFTSMKAVPVANIAALDSSGALDTTWNATADDGSVRALAFSPDGSRLYVGGAFANFSGQPRGHLAAVSTADGTLADWPQGDGADGWVMALATAGSTVYAGGSFANASGQPRNRLAAFDADSGSLSGWNPNADDNVYAINASCGAVYVGGSFGNVGGAARDRIAALDPADGTATAWDPGASSAVHALAASAQNVYAGGYFTVIGGGLRNGIAALDRGTGKATPWSPFADHYWHVQAVALSPDDNTVYVGGSFSQIGGADRSKLAAIDAATGTATEWNPSVDPVAGNDVDALATSGDDVFVGGEFRSVGARMQQGWASFDGGADGGGPAAPLTCPKDTPPPAPAPEPTPQPEIQTLGVVAHSPLLVSGFSATPKRFVVGRTATALVAKRTPAGTTFRYTLSRDARVTISIVRVSSGRRAGKRCVDPSKARRGAKRCVRLVTAGTLRRPGKQGPNAVAFSGRLAKRALPVGSYRATLVATDPANGDSSKPSRTPFVIINGDRG